VTRPALLAVLLVACTGSDTDSDVDTDPVDLGPTARAQVFNATATVPVFDLGLPDGPVLAAGISQGAGSERIDLPTERALRLAGEDLDHRADPLGLQANATLSVFFVGDGGTEPYRPIVLDDALPEPIPGVAHVRFVLSPPWVTGSSDVLVDGSVLVGDLGFDQPWPALFHAVGAGPGHPVRLDAPGEAWDGSFPDQTFEDGGVYTGVIYGPAGSDGGLRLRITEHPRE